MKKDVKQLLEFLEAIQAFSGLMGKVMQDGKVDMVDMPTFLLELASKMNIYSEAYKDAGEIMDELNDLDQSEVLLLVNGIYKSVYAFEKSRKGVA